MKNKEHPFWTIFNIFKKFVDPLDDIWGLMRGILPKSLFDLVGPLISGCVGFFVHFIEACQNAKNAYEAYYDNKIGQRRTRIGVGILSIITACIGVGVSVSLIIGTGNLPLLAVAVNALLASIYSLSLLKNAYIFHQYKKQGNNKKTLEAERAVAFNLLEVLGTCIITLGILLGSPTLIGMTIGLLPIATLLTGVAIGAFTKVFDWLDEKHKMIYTKTLRSLLFSSTTTIFEKIPTVVPPTPTKTDLKKLDAFQITWTLAKQASKNIENKIPPGKHQPALSANTTTPACF